MAERRPRGAGQPARGLTLRERLVRAAAGLLGLCAAVAADAAPLVATRFWPAEAYTRLTLEAATPITWRIAVESAPARVVLELDDVDAGPMIDTLPARVAPSDPYVAALRVTRPTPRVTRLAFDLKTAVAPQAFLLKPVGEYGHRLVLDFYPATPAAPDPLLALLRDRDGAPTPAPAATPSPPTRAATDTPAAVATPPASASPAAIPGTRPLVVAIDAGHGGEDPGAHGGDGTLEKHVTLAIARKVKAALDEDPNFAAVLVRDGDFFIPLHQRVVKARAAQADVFVSIHADAFVKPHARGSSVFALSEGGATSAAARWLAKRENDADLIGGVNIDVADPVLKRVLLDLSQTATIEDSKRLGRALLAEIGHVNTLHKRHVEQAGFAVLKAPDIPSVLVETAFISNPEEEARLADEDYQWTMARAIAGGLKRWFAKTPGGLARARAPAAVAVAPSGVRAATAVAALGAGAAPDAGSSAGSTVTPGTGPARGGAPTDAFGTAGAAGTPRPTAPAASVPTMPTRPIVAAVAGAASVAPPTVASPDPVSTAAAPSAPVVTRVAPLASVSAAPAARTARIASPPVAAPRTAVQRAALARAAAARGAAIAATDAVAPAATPIAPSAAAAAAAVTQGRDDARPLSRPALGTRTAVAMRAPEADVRAARDLRPARGTIKSAGLRALPVATAPARPREIAAAVHRGAPQTASRDGARRPAIRAPRSPRHAEPTAAAVATAARPSIAPRASAAAASARGRARALPLACDAPRDATAKARCARQRLALRVD